MLLAGCGRVGFDSTGAGPFDATGEGALDAPRRDDSPMIDGPPGSVTYTFGEAEATMFKNVTRDTYISNDLAEPALNYGGDTEIRIERGANKRALIGFEIQNVPTTALVLFATLEFTATRIPVIPAAIDIHPVLEAWDEGNQSGTNGVANYTTRVGAISWSSAGAGQPSSSGPSVAQFTPALGRQTISLPVSMISAWVTGPNHGMILLSTSDDSTRLTTSEGTPSVDRPVLTVKFVP